MYDFAAKLPSIIELIDIFLVAVVLYWVMRLVRNTRAERMLWGLAVIVLVYFISDRVHLYTFHWILNKFLASIVLLVIVVFQKDIRKALGEMGRPFIGRKNIETGFLEEVSKGVTAMSIGRIGGLIVIERGIDLLDFVDTGVDIDGEVSKELLLTIFNPSSPMHDGAVIIRAGRVARAGSILPLTSRELTKSMGTRHRAAIGLSEETDGVVIVVSEKTGEISVVVEETLEMGIEPAELLGRLRAVIDIDESASRGIFGRYRQ
ncbi:Diadenylate cyclase spyDAC; Bacterial checkpoint controller DisA with nucleotide-binding domain [hydrothermal vent metagenome]|uniref:Diadenylate cyclase spyDAC Bacterial checkpoint controller DisA with nucleotide-binding domain n=1 Tax=hydrothermal vent metagenome TaxID=652676 RepID=A0A3B0V3M1_9ZZZZ